MSLLIPACFVLMTLHRLVKSSQVLELAAGTDYRRVMADDAEAQQLEVPFGSVLNRSPTNSSSGISSSSSSSDLHSTGSSSESSSSRSGSLYGGEEQQRAGPPSSSAALTGGRLYYWPLTSDSDAALEQKWQEWVSSVKGDLRFNPSLGAAAAAVGEGHVGTVAPTAAAGAAAGRSPVGAGADDSVEEHKEMLPVLFGRQLEVNRAAGGAAWFDFGQLCNQPLGAADYMAISHKYHTVILSGGLAETYALIPLLL